VQRWECLILSLVCAIVAVMSALSLGCPTSMNTSAELARVGAFGFLVMIGVGGSLFFMNQILRPALSKAEVFFRYGGKR